MLRIKKVLLRGRDKDDAVVEFVGGSNVLAGESDTGKSYIFHCLDYILGADSMRKRIPEAEAYSQLFVEFENTGNKVLTLERSLSGGQLAAHSVPIDDITEPGRVVLSKRTGKSIADDVTAVIFAFAGIDEAQLRKNDRGQVQRLTIRTMLPVFLVDEVSVIDDRSPVLGDSSFDRTARKRMLSYMLTGKDDEGIIAAEREDIIRTRLTARLGVIDDLLQPLEERWNDRTLVDTEQAINRLDETIASLSRSLSDTSEERSLLEDQRREAIAAKQKAESQLIAIDELLERYRLLEERYSSDLARLDFIAEGAHFFDALQEVRCPLCDQLMTPDHAHTTAQKSADVYQSAKAEAAKILALKRDLSSASESLNSRKETRTRELSESASVLQRVDSRIAIIVAQSITDRLDQLVTRRIDLEAARRDQDQIQTLRSMKGEIEKATRGDDTPIEWEALPSSALRHLCQEIESVLKDWKWKGEARVEFDQTAYDIIVDGQARQSHGKGVRAVLYSAFVIGLLRYCAANKLPHPGFVVIDSPLTSYKKGKTTTAEDHPVDPGVEAAFWDSLRAPIKGTQLIIIENKEPPAGVAAEVHYEWFAGANADPGDRRGFIPTEEE